MQTDDDGLAFLRTLSARLELVLTEEPRPATPKLGVLVAPKGARIVSATLRVERYDRDAARLEDQFLPLTEADWQRVVIARPRIALASTCGRPEDVVSHDAPNGVSFTVRTIADAIAETERRVRGAGEWLGGVDVHHRFFEGLEDRGDHYVACWGS